MTPSGTTRLDGFDNAWFDPGRTLGVRVLWMVISGLVFQTWVPWPSVLKRVLLRCFGARVGRGVVIKPRVNIKYPWNVSFGQHVWVGEGTWIDSLGVVDIGDHSCLSQGCMFETGNHDWSSETFDLMVKPITLEAGCWVAVGAMLLPGARMSSHSVLAAGSVLQGRTEPYAIYSGVPAERIKDRVIRGRKDQ